MDDILLYVGPSASWSQPDTITSANVSRASITSQSARRTEPRLYQDNETSKAQTIDVRAASDSSMKSPFLDRQSDQGKWTAVQNSLDSDDEDDLPDIDKLLSGRIQKNVSATADLDGDNVDGFVDIDEFLSSMKQQSTPVCALPNSHSITELVGSGNGGGSISSSRSTGSNQDPIILSDDESMDSESETDYDDLDVERPADRIASGNAFPFDSLVIDHQGDGNDNDIVDGAKLQLAADRPKLASLCHGSVIPKARPLPVNTELTKGSEGYVDLDITKEMEGEVTDIFAEGDDDDDVDGRSMRRLRSFAISCNGPAFDSDDSNPEL